MSTESFNKALAAFQADIPHVGKGQKATVPMKAGGKYTYDYADLTDITGVAMPLLAKHGLSFTALPTMAEAGFVLRFKLLHADGHAEVGDYPLPDPTRSTPQELGSAITYARRYALCASTGIAPGGEDDDGQKAQEARSSHSSRPVQANRQTGEIPVPDEVKRLKAEVWRVAQARDMDASQLSDDFSTFTEGDKLSQAGPLQLQTYLDYLQRPQVPA
jgi:hypothetical protein